ncbi:hypothetical protein [Streptomyces sp. NPDC059491]|uniref:hypothetical protein n=1 Tax=Streptomyces sp. NPDC059491 TaxID=3346850 RepID=UPI0036AE60D7
MSENAPHGRRHGDGSGDEERYDEETHEGEEPEEDEPGDGRAESAVGCLLSLAGVAVVGSFALTRAGYVIDGGFEGEARDWGTILVELPLILLAGVVVPPLAYATASRRLRTWQAALVCGAVVALGLWGLSEGWQPQQRPDRGDGPGL